jgi:hypothetical protein
MIPTGRDKRSMKLSRISVAARLRVFAWRSGMRLLKSRMRLYYISYWIIGFPVVLFCLNGMDAQVSGVPIQSTKADSPILEIVDHYVGMWPFAGKYIHFRLFESGRSEYEKITKAKSESRWEAVRHEVKLSAEDTQELINLAESPGFLNASEKYPELWSGIDATYIITISYNRNAHRKQITLVNYVPDLVTKARNYYPESVTKLMKKVEEIRDRK